MFCCLHSPKIWDLSISCNWAGIEPATSPNSFQPGESLLKCENMIFKRLPCKKKKGKVSALKGDTRPANIVNRGVIRDPDHCINMKILRIKIQLRILVNQNMSVKRKTIRVLEVKIPGSGSWSVLYPWIKRAKPSLTIYSIYVFFWHQTKSLHNFINYT